VSALHTQVACEDLSARERHFWEQKKWFEQEGHGKVLLREGKILKQWWQ